MIMIDHCKSESKSAVEKNPWTDSSIHERRCVRKGSFTEWLNEDEPPARLYFYEMFAASPGPVAILDEPSRSDVFRQLSSQWKENTWFLSSVRKRIAHPAYLKIIGMGPSALPLIFEALREEPDYWFAALESITRANPAPHAENMYELRDAWLDWARSHGY